MKMAAGAEITVIIEKGNHYEPVGPTGIGRALDLFAKRYNVSGEGSRAKKFHTIYVPWRRSPILYSGTQSFTSFKAPRTHRHLETGL